MNFEILVYILFGVGIGLAVGLYLLDRSKRKESLYRWASDSGLKLLTYRQPFLTEMSAFPFSLSKSQHVFRIQVETPDGEQQKGWVRVGSAWLGLASAKTDVKWDAVSK